MKKLNTIFLGTPDICLPCLELLKNHPNINFKSIVSMPDRPKGRGKQLASPVVANWAKENSVDLIQTENINKENDFFTKYNNSNVDLIIVFAFAQFLGKKILELPSIGCFNIHTSLLPKFRGAAPIQYALLAGDNKTGSSIQKMVKKMDAGDVAKFLECKITQNDNGQTLYEKLKILSSSLLNLFLKDIINDQVTYTVQDESNVTFAPTIKKEDGFINFANEKASMIINKSKAFCPWPGTYCFINNKRVKILELCLDQQDLKPSEISTIFGSLVVGTKEKSIRISKLQVEGKKAFSDIDFLNGIKSSAKDQNIILTDPK